MTIRDLYEIAEKNNFLDADIVVHLKDGVHDVDNGCLISDYYCMTPEGCVSFSNVAVLHFSEELKEGTIVTTNRRNGINDLKD